MSQRHVLLRMRANLLARCHCQETERTTGNCSGHENGRGDLERERRT